MNSTFPIRRRRCLLTALRLVLGVVFILALGVGNLHAQTNPGFFQPEYRRKRT